MLGSTRRNLKAPNGAEMILVDLNQRSKEWLQWRSQGITATDIPVILGLSPYKTIWRLWAEKIGLINPPDLSKNPNIRRGVRLEDEIRKIAEKRYNDILFPICGEYIAWDVLRASFDGLDLDNKPYEFKAPSDSVFDEVCATGNDLYDEVGKIGSDSISYKMYECQTQVQCLVSGNREGRLIFYKETGEDMDFPIILTREREEEILLAAKTFWEHVVTKTPPKIDPEKDLFIPETTNQIFLWESYSDSWRTQHQRIKDLEKELTGLKEDQKEVQGELAKEMGTFKHADSSGVKVSLFTKQGHIDYKRFLSEQYPNQDFSVELEKYRKAPSDGARFTMSEDKLVNRVAPSDNGGILTAIGEVVTTEPSAYF